MCGGGGCVALNTLFKPNIQINEVVSEQQPGLFQLQGFLYLKPQDWLGKGLYACQSLIKAEKIAQIANESFHVLHHFLQNYLSPKAYELCQNIHDGAHALSESLHIFAFANDVLSLAARKFVVHRHVQGHPVDYVRTAARLCHFVGHGFTTIAFLDKISVISLGKWSGRVTTSISCLTAAGYSLYTITLIWRRLNASREDKSFVSDLVIQAGGAFIEGISLARELLVLSKATFFILSKLRSSIMIIQSLCILNRLATPERQAIHLRVNTNSL